MTPHVHAAGITVLTVLAIVIVARYTVTGVAAKHPDSNFWAAAVQLI